MNEATQPRRRSRRARRYLGVLASSALVVTMATAAKSRTNGHVAIDAALMQTSGLVGHATEGRER